MCRRYLLVLPLFFLSLNAYSNVILRERPNWLSRGLSVVTHIGKQIAASVREIPLLALQPSSSMIPVATRLRQELEERGQELHDLVFKLSDYSFKGNGESDRERYLSLYASRNQIGAHNTPSGPEATQSSDDEPRALAPAPESSLAAMPGMRLAPGTPTPPGEGEVPVAPAQRAMPTTRPTTYPVAVRFTADTPQTTSGRARRRPVQMLNDYILREEVVEMMLWILETADAISEEEVARWRLVRYRGKHRPTGRDVVIESVPRELLIGAGRSPDAPTDAEERAITVLKELQHPYLQRLFDAIDDRRGAQVHLVYVPFEGTPLDEMAPVEPALLQEVAVKMAELLEHCHRHGVVLGNVHPHNIMVAREGSSNVIKLVGHARTAHVAVLPRGVLRDGARSLAFAPDGTTLAVGGSDRCVHIWRVADAAGHPLSATRRVTLTGHQGTVWCLHFTGDGALLASASADRTVRLWEATADGTDAWRCVKVLAGHSGAVTSVAFSPLAAAARTAPSTRWVATGSTDGTFRLFDMASEWKCALVVEPAAVCGIAFSPSGALVATANADCAVRVYTTGSTSPQHVLRGHEGSATAVSFVDSEERLNSASADKTVRMWTRNPDSGPEAGKWSGRIVYAGSDSTVFGAAVGTVNGTQQLAAAHASSAALRPVDGDAAVLRLGGPMSSAVSVSFNGGASLLAVGDQDGSASVYRTTDLTQPIRLAVASRVLQAKTACQELSSFTPPEQAADRATPPTFAADVWALWVTLFVAATGVEPFTREQINAGQYERDNSSLVARVPQLAPIIDGMRSLNPASRSSSQSVFETLTGKKLR